MTPAASILAFGLLAGDGDVPVDPTGDEARRWIIEELSGPQYQAAKPTWWDLLSQAFWDWLSSLDLSGAGFLQGPLLAIVVTVIAAVIVAAFLIFGVPRLRRRSALGGALFGEDEDRASEQLRAAARSAAASGDWALAIEELFRCLARVMSERVLVSTDPGATATGFAARAGAVFPGFADRLGAGAGVFDRVRYLGGRGTETDYRDLLDLEQELRAARPLARDRAASEMPEPVR
ncbi:DUF4129 domain-containing protein [Leifsonia bigeumensis]|uniref:DUF4129 domain-containing protein n=1 Tax=Leifsonella bigeumensis TaxID=433643 RepID=A0ABP7FBL6_9MICO